MSGTNGQRRPAFHVSVTAPAQEQLQAIADEATPVGLGPAIAAAFRRMRARLQADARNAGEPLYHFRSMRVTVYRLAISPLYVEYGVHDVHPVVFVRRIVWLNSPSA